MKSVVNRFGYGNYERSIEICVYGKSGYIECGGFWVVDDFDEV